MDRVPGYEPGCSRFDPCQARHEPFALPCWVHALYLRKNAKRSDEWYGAKLRFMAQPLLLYAQS